LGKSSGCVPFSQHLQKMCLAPNWQPTTMKKGENGFKAQAQGTRAKKCGERKKSLRPRFP